MIRGHRRGRLVLLGVGEEERGLGEDAAAGLALVDLFAASEASLGVVEVEQCGDLADGCLVGAFDHEGGRSGQVSNLKATS